MLGFFENLDYMMMGPDDVYLANILKIIHLQSAKQAPKDLSASSGHRKPLWPSCLLCATCEVYLDFFRDFLLFSCSELKCWVEKAFNIYVF